MVNMAVKKSTENAVLYASADAVTDNTVNNADNTVNNADNANTADSEVNTGENSKDDEKASRFKKEQILKSKKYENYTDVLNVVLGESKYTIDEVDNLLKEFFNKEVK